MKFRVPASVEILQPKSREQWLDLRRPNIGASVAGALLGVHSYQTAYGLYALKAGLLIEDPEESAAMKRGRLLEPVAIELLQEERPRWKIEANVMPGGAYFVDRPLRLSATPDAFAIDPDRAGFGVIQIKSVESGIFRKVWRDPDSGDVVPPLWIGVQAILEAHLTGATWAAIGALVIGSGAEVHLVEVPVHAGVIHRIREAVAGFWRLIDAGTPPDPDYARDGETIAALYADDDGSTVDLSGDNALPGLADEYQHLGAETSAAERRRKAIKAEILAKLGAARAGRLADGRLITAATVQRDAYQVSATSYRSIRVTAARATAPAFEGAF